MEAQSGQISAILAGDIIWMMAGQSAGASAEETAKALNRFKEGIRSEEARRLLPLLRDVEWSCPDGLLRMTCPICTAVQGSGIGGRPLGHATDCTLAAQISRLERLQEAASV